jgi:SAM-dependent methyltransferase
VQKHSRILDYGCGNGTFVAYLRKRGYQAAEGFDRYNPAFSSEAVLWRRFDLILAHDVLEHVPNVSGVMRELKRLLVPGGVLMVGTPNAADVDLGRPDDFIHVLHQPFHRKILSRGALLVLAYRYGLVLERQYRTSYANTRIPFLNGRFRAHYLRSMDDTLDAGFDPIDLRNRRLWTLRALLLGFLGSFFPDRGYITALFRAVDPSVIPPVRMRK